MKVKIEVTREDILMGKQRSNCSCPIALAAKRIGETWNISANDISRSKDGVYVGSVRFPAEAEDFIKNFDRDRASVEPFSFEAEIFP